LLTCRVPRFAAPLVLAAAVLAGCTGSTSVSSPTPTASVTTASPTPTLSEGEKAANDTVVKYRALIDQLRQQTPADSTKLLTYARGSAYEKWRLVLQDDAVNDYRQVGVTSFTGRSTDPGASTLQWRVTGCLDGSKADVVDKAGKSIVTEPPTPHLVVYIVDQDTSTLRWYVTGDEATGSC
jgi:hypothetical protein